MGTGFPGSIPDPVPFPDISHFGPPGNFPSLSGTKNSQSRLPGNGTGPPKTGYDWHP